jgi:hypothetical protein
VVKEFGERFSLRLLIETGTFLGDMVYAMRNQFDHIISIELGNVLYLHAVLRFIGQRHIRILHGDSTRVLVEILGWLREPALFWLDAHYSGRVTAKGNIETPIVEEVMAIVAHPIKQHVILIDDARCFNGVGDYPTLHTLRALVARPGFVFEVRDDIIRIYPAKVGYGFNTAGDRFGDEMV